jgi:hypothetical protein
MGHHVVTKRGLEARAKINLPEKPLTRKVPPAAITLSYDKTEIEESPAKKKAPEEEACKGMWKHVKARHHNNRDHDFCQ